MTMIDIPAEPGLGPDELPTPSLPGDNQPAEGTEGPQGLPTPSLPGGNTGVFRCPLGYAVGITRGGQTFTDLLLENNVSYQAMRFANPSLPTSRLSPGTPYCIPPAFSRRLCPSGTRSYVMGVGESLQTLVETEGIQPSLLLIANPTLAPEDFTPGRVVCLP
ncbi:MAG: hypothetical protein E7319_08830 [Clostridiales bacterium]|nr:hypothetical protein [Clostridiales bacterium]